MGGGRRGGDEEVREVGRWEEAGGRRGGDEEVGEVGVRR